MKIKPRKQIKFPRINELKEKPERKRRLSLRLQLNLLKKSGVAAALIGVCRRLSGRGLRD